MTARRRATVLLVALVTSIAAAAWSATPACACGGGSGYSIYEPFVDLPGLVDFDGEGVDLEGAIGGPHAFRFSFLAPFVIADSTDATRAQELADLSAIWEHRTFWGDPPSDDSATPAQLRDSAFTAALRTGALDQASTEARTLVARSLDMPASVAQREQPVVRRAVEFLELRPQLAAGTGPVVDGPQLARFFAAAPAARAHGPQPDDAGSPVLRGAALLRTRSRAELAREADVLTTSPRRASLRFVALQERTRALVPAGWPAEDTVRADSAERRALRADYARWLADYPTHPLADLVRLSTVRVDRLLGDTVAMWTTLLDAYPRHRGRVVAEMHYLLVAGVDPPRAVRARIHDPLLRSALVFGAFDCTGFACSMGTARSYDRDAWNAEWQRAQAARPAPWALNLEERLLRIALADSGDRRLPRAFPAVAAAPTPLWGTLRLALLIRAGRWEEADAQAALLAAGRATAALRMRLALRRGQWSRALAEPGLHPDTRRYLLQVLAPDSVLERVAAAPDSEARLDAVHARAARRAATGDWMGAARLVAVLDTPLAARLTRTAARATDRSSAGRVAFAEHLVEQQDSLLGGADEREWYRTIEGRWQQLIGDTLASRETPATIPDVPWTRAVEEQATRRFLRENSELYLALGAYAEALGPVPTAPLTIATRQREREIAREADVPYNRLINRNYEYTVFWPRELARDPTVQRIRRAGRR